jgi:hypothetical protein
MEESAGDAKIARFGEPADSSAPRSDDAGAGAMWFNRA